MAIPVFFRTAAVGALLVSFSVRADVKDVLRKLGENARAQEIAAPCTYRETTTVDELGKNNQVVGSEVRTFDVEVKGTEVTRRDIVSITKSGAPLADLLEQPRDTKGKKAARSPLHPEAQADYIFALKDGPADDEQTVTIEPRRPSMERMRGEAVVNARTLELNSLRFTPSKVPLLLKSLEMGFQYGDTACGRMPVVLTVEGQGVAIFIETKFRTRSVVEGHARVSAQKK